MAKKAESAAAAMRIEKKGGYSGGRPASTMSPPRKVPSGAVKAESRTLRVTKSPSAGIKRTKPARKSA